MAPQTTVTGRPPSAEPSVLIGAKQPSASENHRQEGIGNKCARLGQKQRRLLLGYLLKLLSRLPAAPSGRRPVGWRGGVEELGGRVGWRSCSCRSCPREETGAAGPNCVSNALRCAAAPWEGRRNGGAGGRMVKGEEAESRLVHILTRHVIQLQHTGISSPGKKNKNLLLVLRFPIQTGQL